MSKDDFKVEYILVEKTSKEIEDSLFLALSLLISYEDLNLVDIDKSGHKEYYKSIE